MGRMKEIYMEIQEQFDGNIPDNFDFDAYIDEKLKTKCSTMKVTVVEPKTSNCCGGDMSTLVTEDGPEYQDLGICPICKDHCSTN